MKKQYANLQDLLRYDGEAKEYYSALPNYVQEHISQRQDNVNSLASLQDYAENLLRGDI